MFTALCIVGWAGINTVLMWYQFIVPLIESEDAAKAARELREDQALWDRQYAWDITHGIREAR